MYGRGRLGLTGPGWSQRHAGGCGEERLQRHAQLRWQRDVATQGILTICHLPSSGRRNRCGVTRGVFIGFRVRERNEQHHDALDSCSKKPDAHEADETVSRGEYTASNYTSVSNGFAAHGLALLAHMTKNETVAAAGKALEAAIVKAMWNGSAFCDGPCSEVRIQSFYLLMLLGFSCRRTVCWS